MVEDIKVLLELALTLIMDWWVKSEGTRDDVAGGEEKVKKYEYAGKINEMMENMEEVNID